MYFSSILGLSKKPIDQKNSAIMQEQEPNTM